MEKSLGQALSEHDVKPIGQPTIDDVSFEGALTFHLKRHLKYSQS